MEKPVEWDQLESYVRTSEKHTEVPVFRARVQGGWLVMVGPPEGDLRPAFFLPDPNHTWEALSIRNKKMAAV